MFLLDTDVLIWILRGKQEVVDWVLGVKETKSLGISVISIAEIYKNIFPHQRNHLTRYASLPNAPKIEPAVIPCLSTIGSFAR